MKLPVKSLLALAAAAFAASASAQQYPNKPVRLINPWTPAGPAELLTRIIGAELQKSLGQPFIVENKPGANGTIGATFVAKSAPDGYHILFSHVGPMAISPAVVEKMPYDTLKDFAPITQVASGSLVLLVRNDIPITNLKELVAYGKANQGKMSCGSVGPASTSHLACELFNILGGVQTIHVPYKGSAPVITDMLGGQISISFLNIAGVKPQLDAKQLRPVAVTTLRRSAVLPDLPAMNDTMPGFEVNSWYGMMAPAGTPKDIVQLLQRETAKALKLPEVVDRLKQFGLDPVGNTPEEHAAQLRVDLERWSKVAKAAKIKVD